MILRVASVYNRYLNRGGEDEAFEREARLLRKAGHHVVEVTAQTVTPASRREAVRIASESLWSRGWHARFGRLLAEERIDVVHVHNLFPVLSPSILHASASAKVPVVHTLHNYRLICPKATLYRDSHVCEDCLATRLPWPAVRHRCYHRSRAQSATVAAMVTLHRWLGTWTDKVDAYVALTEFARAKLVEGGLPPAKVFVKPNFVDPDPGAAPAEGRSGALFVGRLSEEKGLRTLLRAWDVPPLPLTVVGDGPLEAEVQRASAAVGGAVRYLGRRPHDEVLRLLGEADFLVFPSECYEGLPLSVIEAYARGTPVVAAAHGAMAEIVAPGRTGLLFEPGDVGDLARVVRAAAADGGLAARLGGAARAEYEARYTAGLNLDRLVAIYRSVLNIGRPA